MREVYDESTGRMVVVRPRTFYAVSTTEDGDRFRRRLRARYLDDAMDEAGRLSYESTRCQTVDVYDSTGEVASMIDLEG